MFFKFEKTKLKNLVVVHPKFFGDDRGFFMETYVRSEFEKAGITENFIHDAHSRSEYNVLRGLHFQQGKYAQTKIIRCVKGIIYDVVIDLRENSETYGKFFGIILSEHNKKMLYVPKGFAHGFLTLSKMAELQYKMDNVYDPESERGLKWNDPKLNINWPISTDPILSNRDNNWPNLEDL